MNQGAVSQSSPAKSPSPSTRDSWRDLFEGGSNEAGGVCIQLQVLRRRGVPFLLLPLNHRGALCALDLYPAQTVRARLFKRLLQGYLRLGLRLPAMTAEYDAAMDAPFLKCLTQAAGRGRIPDFAVFAGNPKTPGQRFIILIFGPEAGPVRVVKVGTQPVAQSLIQHETSFLEAVRTLSIRAIPQVRGQWTDPMFSAFSTDFIAGENPSQNDLPELGAEIEGWIGKKQLLRLSQIPAWQRLAVAMESNELFGRLQKEMVTLTLRPTIWHGDFAPWNIKRAPDRSWHVLDWERAEILGLPCWDLFHYRVQTSILVHRHATTVIAEQLERMLAEEWFGRYAETAQVSQVTRHLALSYLLYHLSLNRATEGVEQCSLLLENLSHRWQLR